MEASEDLRAQSVEHFLEIIRASRKGKFKIYIGMAPGVGKTYLMLQEAHQLLDRGVDICIGVIETHGRTGINNLIQGIPSILKKNMYYKGKSLSEMDLESVLIRKPEIVLVDELAHTNIPGSRNNKRWEDVVEIIQAGINVISTLNIQHIEGINKEVESITEVEIKERIPDSVLQMADEVVNVDLTINDLIKRLEEGKIYDMKMIPVARRNFFQESKLLRLRELALREVVRQVVRKINKDINITLQRNKAIITCISSNGMSGKNLIRQSFKLAPLYDSKWYVLHVEPSDNQFSEKGYPDQSQLFENLKLASDLNAEAVRIRADNIAEAIIDFSLKKEAGLIIIGKSSRHSLNFLNRKNILKKLLRQTTNNNIDLLILSSHE